MGHLNLQAETTDEAEARPHERALAAFNLRMLGTDGARLAAYGTKLDTQGQPPGALLRERKLRISLSNPHGEALAATLEMSMRIRGYTALNAVASPLAAPVPEPGMVGLMLSGMGVEVRRGRRAQGLAH